MVDSFRYPEFWAFSVLVLVGVAAVHACLWRKGKASRISGGDWALIFGGLVLAWFAINNAVRWQDARIVELIQKLVPMHAHLIEDGVLGKVILETTGSESIPDSGESASEGVNREDVGIENAASTLAPEAQEAAEGIEKGGIWVVGFVPMSDNEGKVKAVLDVDYINGKRAAAVNAMRKMATAVVASLFVAIMGIVVYFRVRAEFLRSEIEIARALAESENRFRLLFKDSPDAIFVNTPDGCIRDVNPTACDMLRVGSEQLIGRYLTDLVEPEQKNDVLARIRELAAGETDRIGNTNFVTSDGRHIPVDVRARKILYPDQPVFLLHVHDLTDRVALENELRQAQKMEGIGQLAAGVAHDFNNLLTVIQGHTVMMMENHAGQDELVDSLREVASAAERAAELTGHLLTFSRKQQMRLQFLDANDVLNNYLRLLSRVIPEHIELKLETNVRVPSIRADRGMIEQVITNLAVNARDAMPEGGLLTLSTSVAEFAADEVFENPETRPGKYVVITVKDTGVGMDEATLRHIFEPFFTTKDVGKGTGLGLASAYGIVAQHGGWIRVESKPGRGTAFSIYLPAREAPAMVVESAPADDTAVLGGEETILIVEDEPALRELVALNLERHGYTVIKAASGREALGLWKDIKDDVDLVLTDLVMPDGISGRELGRRLSAENCDLPIVYMSGYSGNVTGIDEQEDADRPILQKPYTPNALARTIRSTLDCGGGSGARKLSMRT